MKHKNRQEGWLVFFDARKSNGKQPVPPILNSASGTIRTVLIDINPAPPSQVAKAQLIPLKESRVPEIHNVDS